MPQSAPIPIVDLFAGPGGLGEGFSSIDDGKAFKIIVSAEMEASAHQTLRLRSFYRILRRKGKNALVSYYKFCNGETPLPYDDDTFSDWEEAGQEAKQITLGTEAGKAGNKDTKDGREYPEIEPRPRPFRIDASANNVRVLPNGSRAPKQDELPIHCVLEMAYEGLDQDPFKEYDPFDFDLSDIATHEIESNGVLITGRSGNKVEFDVIEPEFKLQVSGFDSNIRMRARLNFKEESNGATVSEE